MGAMKELSMTIDDGGLLGKSAEYIYKGWKVLPLQPNSKDPHFDLIRRAYLDATDRWEALKFWYKMDPNMNIGIACQPSGLVVFDIDYRNGGEFLDIFPETYTVQTGDGLHLYYTCDANVNFRGTLDQGIDIKWKGYVAAAPSIHPNGKTYTVINNMDAVAITAELLEMGAK